MSSISSTTSTTTQSGISSLVQEFEAIGNALQSGNTSSATGVLNNFQSILQSVSQSSSSQPFGPNTQANTDYATLLSSLQSGNLSVAQTAFSSLTTDLLASAATQTPGASS